MGHSYIPSRSGTKYICQLPIWADEKARLWAENGEIILAHPNYPPHIFDEDKNEFVPMRSTPPSEPDDHRRYRQALISIRTRKKREERKFQKLLAQEIFKRGLE